MIFPCALLTAIFLSEFWLTSEKEIMNCKLKRCVFWTCTYSSRQISQTRWTHLREILKWPIGPFFLPDFTRARLHSFLSRRRLRSISMMLWRLIKCISWVRHGTRSLCLTEKRRSFNLKTFNYFDVTWWQVANMPHACEIIFSFLALGLVLWLVYSLSDKS